MTPSNTSPDADWACRVEKWPVDRLRAAERNARRHSKRQLSELRESLRRFGFTKAILARRDGRIIAGHGRHAAAVAEGYKEIPVVVAPDSWNDVQCRAYALIDNKIALNSGWDAEVLSCEVRELHALDANLIGVGFSETEVANLLSRSEELAATAAQLGEDLKYQIVVECRDEKHQAELLSRFEQENIGCRALIS